MKILSLTLMALSASFAAQASEGKFPSEYVDGWRGLDANAPELKVGTHFFLTENVGFNPEENFLLSAYVVEATAVSSNDSKIQFAGKVIDQGSDCGFTADGRWTGGCLLPRASNVAFDINVVKDAVWQGFMTMETTMGSFQFPVHCTLNHYEWMAAGKHDLTCNLNGKPSVYGMGLDNVVFVR